MQEAGILQAISIVAKSLAAKLMQIEKEVEAYEAAKVAAYSRMAYEQGFLPIAPHLLFPQFLNEGIEEERQLGIAMGMEQVVDWVGIIHEGRMLEECPYQ